MVKLRDGEQHSYPKIEEAIQELLKRGDQLERRWMPAETDDGM